MRKPILHIAVVNAVLAVAALALAVPSSADYLITAIIDYNGDGGGNGLNNPHAVAADSSGNVYVTGEDSDNAFKITPDGTITEIIDVFGDGTNQLHAPRGVAVDSSGNVYVTGYDSDNAFKIATPGTCSTGGTPCTITEIIDSDGDGGVFGLMRAWGVATDSSGNVYVAGYGTYNAFKIATPGTCSTGGTPCTITEIIDYAGDGGTYGLDEPLGVAVDSSDNVFVTGHNSHNAFKIAAPGTCSTGGTPCTITEIIDWTGDGGTTGLGYPVGIATDGSGNVYLAGSSTDNGFKIATPGTCSTGGTPCTITEIIDASGDGGGNSLDWPQGVAADADGNAYLAAYNSDNAFRISSGGTITEIIDASGDGGSNAMWMGYGVAVDSSRNVYVASWATHVVFRIRAGVRVPALSNGGLAVLGVSLVGALLWLAWRRRPANA